MKSSTPHETVGLKCEPGWFDAAGHLKTAFYIRLFERGSDDVFEGFGLGADYVQQRGGSFYLLEMRIQYQRSVLAGQPLKVTFQLLDYDAKRCHFAQELRHELDGWLAASAEAICMHVDMRLKKAAPFPNDILSAIDEMYRAHKGLPRSTQIGTVIGIK